MCTKGGIDGPAGLANAGALPLCAMPDHSCLCDELDPTRLLSRNGNSDVEHVQWRRKMFLSRGAESKQVKTRFTHA